MLSSATALPSSRGKLPPTRRHQARDAPVAGLRLGTTILIVEDELMIAWTLQSILEDMGFRDIHMAANCGEAQAAAALAPPGLIVSDLNLGRGPDGVETAIRINAIVPVPVLFVTAYADEPTRARIGQSLPSALVLLKPLQLEDLQTALRTLLGKRSN